MATPMDGFQTAAQLMRDQEMQGGQCELRSGVLPRARAAAAAA